MFSEKFGDDQYEVGGRNPFFEFAHQPDTHDLGNRHVIGLSQHDGFCFDAANPPSHHTDAVNHGGV